MESGVLNAAYLLASLIVLVSGSQAIETVAETVSWASWTQFHHQMLSPLSRY